MESKWNPFVIHKPHPWYVENNERKEEEKEGEKTLRLHGFTRKLVVLAGPRKLKINKRNQNYMKKKSSLDNRSFMIRNLLKGVNSWDTYIQKVTSWQNSKIDNSQSPQADSRLYLLHSVWHLSKLERKPIHNLDDSTRALTSLTKSKPVQHSLQKPPRDLSDVLFTKEGVPIAVVNKKDLTPKAKFCLSRWARILNYTDQWEPGEESGEEDDPIEMWNNMVNGDPMEIGDGDDLNRKVVNIDEEGEESQPVEKTQTSAIVRDSVANEEKSVVNRNENEQKVAISRQSTPATKEKCRKTISKTPNFKRTTDVSKSLCSQTTCVSSLKKKTIKKRPVGTRKSPRISTRN